MSDFIFKIGTNSHVEKQGPPIKSCVCVCVCLYTWTYGIDIFTLLRDEINIPRQNCIRGPVEISHGSPCWEAYKEARKIRTSKSTNNWLKTGTWRVLEWWSQSPDPHPTDMDDTGCT